MIAGEETELPWLSTAMIITLLKSVTNKLVLILLPAKLAIFTPLIHNSILLTGLALPVPPAEIVVRAEV